MAALTLALGVALAADGVAKPAPASEPDVKNTVTLKLRITGLGREGCEVVIKPGHAACDFKPITKKLDSTGEIKLEKLEVMSSSADRDCLFAITVKEPGQAPKTVKRGLRLSSPAEGKPVPHQDLMCLLRSPSLVARDDATKRVK